MQMNIDKIESPSILIVEDDDNTREGLKAYFEVNNCRVDTAKDALEALDILAKTPYSTLIVGHHIKKMTAIEFVSKLREANKLISIIYISSNFNESLANKLKLLNVDRYFEKPINPNILHEHIAKFHISSQVLT